VYVCIYNTMRHHKILDYHSGLTAGGFVQVILSFFVNGDGIALASQVQVQCQCPQQVLKKAIRPIKIIQLHMTDYHYLVVVRSMP